MSAIIKVAAPAELLFQPTDEKKIASLDPEAKFNRRSPICESELQWRQLLARVVTPKFAMIEMFALVLFLVATVVAVISCFVELSHLLDGDALGHVVAKAIKGGR
jgi:hypothetical protein